jgi:hypothetical protein
MSAAAAHEHAWSAIDGETALYSCACGATGYRSWWTGEIRERPRKVSREAEPTARAASLTDEFGHGRVTSKPGAP